MTDVSSINSAAEVKSFREHTITFLDYLLVIFIILEFNTVYTSFDRIRSLMIYGALGIIVLLMLLRKSVFRIDGIIWLYFLGSILPFLNVSHGGERSFMKFYWMVLPLFLFYLSSLKRNGFDCVASLFIKYSNVVFILSIISLVYWVAGSNLTIISPTMYVPNTWKGIGIEMIPTYHFIYFETQESSFMGYETVRNSGIFNEGPMYNMILCVALSIELFLRPIKSIKRLIIIGITIATTFTTTGVIFLGLTAVWIIFHFFSEKARALLIIVIPLLAVGMMTFSNAVLEDKQTSSGEGSMRSRMYDITTCIDIGMENPLLGQGLFTKKLGEADGGLYGYSNSLFTFFADGGFYTVFLYIASLVLIPLRDYLKDRETLWPLMMFAYFLLFTFTLSQYQLLTFLFVAFGLLMFTSSNGSVVENNYSK